MGKDETACKYVGSRGLMKSCTSRSSTPISSIPVVFNQRFDRLAAGDSVYICSAALNDFVEKWLDTITVRFVLLTGDSDDPVPLRPLSADNFERLISSEKLIAWFAQNLSGSDAEDPEDMPKLRHLPKDMPKLRHLPIGLDYHTLSERNHPWGPMTSPIKQEELLTAISCRAKPFFERKPMAYTTFHFELNRGGRQQAYDEIPAELVHYEPERVPRILSWKRQTEYAFVVSPPGEGLDCHRTWEALCLGCIPILKSTSLDPMFDDLPVLIVQSWTDLSKDLLLKTVAEVKDKQARGGFRMEKLTLKYWTDLIRAAGKDG